MEFVEHWLLGERREEGRMLLKVRFRLVFLPILFLPPQPVAAPLPRIIFYPFSQKFSRARSDAATTVVANVNVTWRYFVQQEKWRSRNKSFSAFSSSPSLRPSAAAAAATTIPSLFPVFLHFGEV
jgi:hypothetical protein